MTPRRSFFDRNRSPFLARQKRSTVQVARFKRVEQVERVERHFCVWRFAPPNALRLPSVFHDLFLLSVLERSPLFQALFLAFLFLRGEQALASIRLSTCRPDSWDQLPPCSPTFHCESEMLSHRRGFISKRKSWSIQRGALYRLATLLHYRWCSRYSKKEILEKQGFSEFSVHLGTADRIAFGQLKARCRLEWILIGRDLDSGRSWKCVVSGSTSYLSRDSASNEVRRNGNFDNPN